MFPADWRCEMTEDRLIPQAGVEALIDLKIDALNTLLKNNICRGMNRKIVAAQISALLAVREQLKFISPEPWTPSRKMVVTATGPVDVDLRKLAIDPSNNPGGIKAPADRIF
jgi:hypothetical protein